MKYIIDISFNSGFYDEAEVLAESEDEAISMVWEVLIKNELDRDIESVSVVDIQPA